MTATIRIRPAEEIVSQPVGEAAHLRLPAASLFSDRAARLRRLAPGHALEDYLSFIAKVADAQQQALNDVSGVGVPTPAQLQQAHEHGMPPLNAQHFQRDRLWCDLLRRMLRGLAEVTDGKVKETAIRLEGERDELYEAQASKLLAGVTFGLDTGTAPLIGAALQVYFTHLARTLGEGAIKPIDVATVCPCCGQPPTASIARIGTGEGGHRYLHCSLCATEWHMVRIKCTHCEATEHVDYHSIDDGRPGNQHTAKAETCEDCGSYLKIFYQERDPGIEPVADDLATLPLDIMVAEELGKQCGGVNLMLIHGDPGDS
jgi:FdhE protein